MGGRGSSSGGGSGNNKQISALSARIAFNAAKKSGYNGNGPSSSDKTIEKAIKSGNGNFIDSIKSEKEARRVSEYLNDRMGQVNKKIRNLGSAENLQKNPKLFHERANIAALSNSAREKIGKLRDISDFGKRDVVNNTVTTTYERARKRRISNFDAWFNGGR